MLTVVQWLLGGKANINFFTVAFVFWHFQSPTGEDNIFDGITETQYIFMFICSSTQEMSEVKYSSSQGKKSSKKMMVLRTKWNYHLYDFRCPCWIKVFHAAQPTAGL